MPDWKADQRRSTLLVLYIASADRFGKALGVREQQRWVRRALTVLGKHLSGATAFPRGLGVWRDDAQGGRLVWDKPVLIQCYTSEEALEEQATVIREFLVDMGIATRQGAVGFVIDRDFYEIDFPLESQWRKTAINSPNSSAPRSPAKYPTLAAAPSAWPGWRICSAND